VKEIIATRSPEETFRLGERLAKWLRGGDVVLVSGPLGAGKSVLARGIAAALGASTWRGSPTYNLVHEYATCPPLYHADLYRLAPASVDELGLEEYTRADSVLVVEWADRAPELLEGIAPGRAIHVHIDLLDESTRCIGIEGEGE
jgi:tRNA threonylcarbamoyladenosine biosynthesis protein TsaE